MAATNDQILTALTELKAQINNVQDQVIRSHNQLDQIHAQVESGFDSAAGQIKVMKDRLEIPNLNLIQDIHNKMSDIQTKLASIILSSAGHS